MGGSACVIIITNGNQAYGVVEVFSEANPQVNTLMLEAAINASCDVVHHTSLYFTIEGDDRLTSEYTKPIIALHDRIINELPNINKQSAQTLVDTFTEKLMEATRKIQELFDD